MKRSRGFLVPFNDKGISKYASIFAYLVGFVPKAILNREEKLQTQNSVADPKEANDEFWGGVDWPDGGHSYQTGIGFSGNRS